MTTNDHSAMSDAELQHRMPSGYAGGIRRDGLKRMLGRIIRIESNGDVKLVTLLAGDGPHTVHVALVAGDSSKLHKGQLRRFLGNAKSLD